MSTPSPSSTRRVPVWFAVICIIAALPVLAFPSVLSSAQEAHSLFIRLWPVYAIASSWLAWSVYFQRRPLAWILIVLTLMSHTAIFALAFGQ